MIFCIIIELLCMLQMLRLVITEWFIHLQEIRGHSTPSDEIVLEELSLPGLSELKGRWRGSLDASGGGNGDTMVNF